MFGVSTGTPAARKRKSAHTTNIRPSFTFREVRSAKRKDSSKCGGAANKKVATVFKKSEDELQHLLTELDVSERERAEYKSLCETCKIGNQALNKVSLRTLFGCDDIEEVGGGKREEQQQRFDDSDDMGGESDSGDEDVFKWKNNKTGRTLFLKKQTDDGGATTRAKKQTGSKHVYLMKIVVGVSQSCFAQSAKTAITKCDTAVCLCLPPLNSATQHGAQVSDQNRLADLMIMKVYFVVRYIYRTLQSEIQSRRLRRPPPSNRLLITPHDGSGVEHRRHYQLNDCRFPAIVIQYAPPQNTSNAAPSTWYKLLKEKIAKGEDTYTRELSLIYRCILL